MRASRELSQERSEQLVAAAELRHVASLLDVEHIPLLSPLAVEQVRVVIGFLQQQAAGLMVMDAEQSNATDDPG